MICYKGVALGVPVAGLGVMHADCLDVLPLLSGVRTIFADPPDNIGLAYNGYDDKMSPACYYGWLERVVLAALARCEVFWLSYYWKHDLEIKYFVRQILKYRHPAFDSRTFLWRYTFGQHREKDCGSGFRFLLRLSRVPMDVVRVESERQRLGDARANPLGRVPDDAWDDAVWSVPRVVGNSAERCRWHPTQHPIGLLDRVLRMSGGPVVDLFAGTGSMLKAAGGLGIEALGIEIDRYYVERVIECGFVEVLV